jgi:hypothetical protein
VKPRTRRVIIGAVLVVVIVAGVWMLMGRGASDPDIGSRRDAGSPAQPDDNRSEEGTKSQPGSSEEESIGVISEAPAKPDDRVSNEIAYELIDSLKASGIEPLTGQPLTLEYVGRLDRVRVSGSFESREATSYVLEFDDGVWKVDE